jgi:hypothetical protein
MICGKSVRRRFASVRKMSVVCWEVGRSALGSLNELVGIMLD